MQLFLASESNQNKIINFNISTTSYFVCSKSRVRYKFNDCNSLIVSFYNRGRYMIDGAKEENFHLAFNLKLM